MNLFFRQMIRKPCVSLLMVLLLSLSVALSGIGYCAWTAAKQQQGAVSGEYTTIAIPQQPDLDGLSPEGTVTALQNTVYADWAAQEAPQLESIDRRCLLSACVSGNKSLSSSRVDPSEYNIAFDGECYNLAVFALRCESIREQATEGVLLYDATFGVEEIVCLSDAYDGFPSPDTIHIYSDVREANGAIPFERGKTYLVFGQYQDYRVVRDGDGYHQVTEEKRYLIPFPEISSNYYGETASLVEGNRNGGSYHYPAAGQLPWVAAYEAGVADFLAEDAASVWNGEILPICRLNHTSAAVVLTDRVQSLYSFNTGEAALLSGRFFSDEEYETGASVCIISAAYAELNDLQPGDTLSLDYYNSGFGEYSNGATANSIFAGEDPGAYRQRYYMTPEDSIGVCKEYTITGIYTGARFSFGAYQFNADTIFVPKASVPNAEEYEFPANALLNTFILKNGSAEEFEQYMQAQGLGGQFLYFDQDFSSMQESLDALETNAMRFMLVGAGALVLVCALFLFLNFRRMKPAIRGVRLLGRAPGTVFAEVFAVLLIQGASAVVLGSAMATLLFGTVTKAVLSAALTLQMDAILTAALAAIALHTLASAISAAVVVNRKLMKAK